LVGALNAKPEDELHDVGQRLAGMAASTSYALGDRQRVKVLGHD
jgi:hypothetical protein